MFSYNADIGPIFVVSLVLSVLGLLLAVVCHCVCISINSNGSDGNAASLYTIIKNCKLGRQKLFALKCCGFTCMIVCIICSVLVYLICVIIIGSGHYYGTTAAWCVFIPWLVFTIIYCITCIGILCHLRNFYKQPSYKLFYSQKQCTIECLNN